MNKIIRNKLTKEVQDLYTENCKTLLKDILKDLNNWKNSLCLWFARLNIVKTAFFFFFLTQWEPFIEHLSSLST